MIRAVICDIYRTILEVLPAPVDAELHWTRLTTGLSGAVPCSTEELSNRCREIVTTDHAQASARGVQFSEVVWPAVVARALPEFAKLDESARENFLFDHMQILRGLRLMPGAAEFLRECVAHGMTLGIASNAQEYTLRELAAALADGGLDVGIFDSELTMWSWRLGFSKPNPHIFQALTARLAHRGIEPEEILMVGDRLDNDIEPARAFGWQTARIHDESDWRNLTEKLFGQP